VSDASDGDSVETDDDGRPRLRPESLSRRRFLGLAGAGVATVGGVRAVHNTLLGYGHLGMGTNLLEQDIPPVLEARLSLGYNERFDPAHVWLDGDDRFVGVEYDGVETVEFDADTDADAQRLDESAGLDSVVSELFADVSSLRADEYAFEFSDYASFFERARDADTRPHLVSAIRSRSDRAADVGLVESFTDADPTDTEALVYGLKMGFREHGHYDVPRYVAGSIEDNVIFGAADLRKHFEDPVDFEALSENGGTGMFCWELVFRSIEALHAVSAWEQTVPVATFYVSDRRHKHAYTGLLTAIRDDDGSLRLPVTFVDYTYSTLYDDFRLTGLRGEGLNAYDSGHRADEVYW